MSKPSKTHASLDSLHQQTGADRRSIKKWLAADDIKRVKSGFSLKPALACIQQHQRQSNGHDQKPSPFAERTRQEVIALERANRIAAKLEDETYMLTEDVEKMILLGISKIENIPSKLESEFGLPAQVVKRLTALQDEARQEWVKGLKGLAK